MTSPWSSGKTSRDTDAFSERFWAEHRENLANGSFWTARIKDLRNQPVERLRVAVENFPLPGAFREAAVALRAIIRDKRKAGVSYSGELACLYWLAAIESFSMPYSEPLSEPGFNVLQSIPGMIVIGLSFAYRTLGHKHLALLSKTDVKWIEAEWGVPDEHSTLLALHRHVWNEYEQRLVRQRESERRQFMNDIGDLLP